MASESPPPSPVRELEAAVERGLAAQHLQSASQASLRTTSRSGAFPGAFPSSISLASVDTRHSSIPPLLPPSDSSLAEPSAPPPTYIPPTSAPSASPVARDIPRVPTPPRPPPPRPPPPARPARLAFIRRTFAFFGIGPENRVRKQLVSIIWTTIIDSLQIVAIIVLLSLATNTVSPTVPSSNQWNACGKPLGAWNAIWTVRTALDFLLAYYHWSQQRKKRLAAITAEDVEHVQPNGERRSRSPPSNARRDAEEQHRHQRGVDDEFRERSNEPPSRSYPAWYSRLSAICTMFGIVWFVMAHIFLYTSTDTCRFSAPYLWWLTFTLLSIMYIAVAEVLLIALVVFIVFPLATLLCNIALLMMGRHPLQNPHYIKPDVHAISRNLVDRIPLVVYIPPPPDEPSSGPITIPPEALSYPPKAQPKPSPPVKRHRFRFLRIKRKKALMKNKKDGDGKDGGDGVEEEEEEEDGVPKVWEDNWEKAEYPFVRLEQNRAACAICLLDFEAPKPRGKRAAAAAAAAAATQQQRQEDAPKPRGDEGTGEAEGVEEIVVTSPTIVEADESAPRLEDAGAGVQPLRLLPCGHVFHQTCLDPWLVGVSGRCPTCQRPVEFPTPEAETPRRRGRRGRRGREEEERTP